MSHPAYGSDQLAYNLFLFDFAKDKLIDKHDGTSEDLFRKVEMIITEIPDELFSWVF
jgi:hypothetical protein